MSFNCGDYWFQYAHDYIMHISARDYTIYLQWNWEWHLNEMLFSIFALEFLVKYYTHIIIYGTDGIRIKHTLNLHHCITQIILYDRIEQNFQ